MNWADVASNQCFSCNTLQNAVTNGYFVLKNAIPVSAKMVNKAEAENYVYINAISGKTSNQLAVKGNLISNPPYSWSLSLNELEIYKCIDNDRVTWYTTSPSLGIGVSIFDQYGQTLAGYYTNGSDWWFQDELSSNTISATGTCASYYMYEISSPLGNPTLNGCPGSYPGTSYTVYSNNPVFYASNRFYTDAALTTTFNGDMGNYPNNYYMNSNFDGGIIIQINSIGYNVDQYIC